MNQHSTRDSESKTTLRSYENNGFVYGLMLGALIGVLIAGPHFREWPLLMTLGAIGVSSMTIGIAGYLAVAMAYTATVGGSSASSSSGDYSSGGDGGGD